MKDTIKQWLKTHGLDRDWLATQIGVNKRTVDNWLSTSKEIPEIKLALIRKVMSEAEAAEAARKQQLDPVAQVFSVEVSLPQYRRYSQAALKAQRTLEDWAIEELDRAAEEYFAKQQGADIEPEAPETEPKKPTTPHSSAA